MKKITKDDIRVLHIPLDHLISSEKLLKMFLEYESEKLHQEKKCN